MFSCGWAWSNAALLVASVSVNCLAAPESVNAPSHQSHLTVQKLVITLGVLLAHLGTGNVSLNHVENIHLRVPPPAPSWCTWGRRSCPRSGAAADSASWAACPPRAPPRARAACRGRGRARRAARAWCGCSRGSTAAALSWNSLWFNHKPRDSGFY